MTIKIFKDFRLDLNYIIRLLLSITLFGAFVDKGIYNIGLLLLVTSIILKNINEKDKKKDKNEKKVLLLFFMPIAIGVISNIISGGIDGMGIFLKNERGLFFPILFYFSLIESNDMKLPLKAITLAGILSCIVATIFYFEPNFYKIIHPTGIFTPERIPSFKDNIRWGYLLHIFFIFLLGLFIKFTKKRDRLIVLSLLGFVSWNIIINGSRATLVTIGFSIFIYILIIALLKIRLRIKNILIYTIVISIFSIFSNNIINNRRPGVESSNSARIHLIKIGLDMVKEKSIFGFGSGNNISSFQNYIGNQSEEYRKKYYYNSVAATGATPFENYYVNMAVENGALFLISLLIVYGYLLCKLALIYKKNNITDKSPLVFIVIFIGSKAYNFFFPESVAYIDFINAFFIYYAIKLTAHRIER